MSDTPCCPFGHESLLSRPIEGEVYCLTCGELYNNTICGGVGLE